MMPPAALARFLKEEVPQYRAYVEKNFNSANLLKMQKLLDALDAAVGLLLEVVAAARPFLNLKDKGEYVLGVITQEHIRELERALEAVSLVVGEWQERKC